MSYVIFPSVISPSMAKGLKKTPNFNSVIQKVAAGRGNAAVSLKPYPTFDFEFDLDHIQGNEEAATSVVAALLGTMMACQGQAQLFLFTDGQDSTVSYTNSGMLDVTAASATPMASVGNASSKSFQLARSIGGLAWDILQNVTITGLKVNGTAKSSPGDYSVSSTGVVTFVSAPASNATLTWQGTFQYLCRFSEDSVDAVREFTTNSGTDLWSVSSIKWSSEFV